MALHLPRVRRIQREIQKQRLDFYLVSNSANLFYLLGLEMEGYLLILSDRVPCLLFSDPRYQLEAEKLESRQLKIYISRKGGLDLLFRRLNRGGSRKRLGLEPSLPLATYLQLKEKACGIKLRSSPILEEVRSVKESSEIAKIEKATAITKKVLDKIRPLLESKREMEIQAILEFEFKKMGAEGSAFPPIVAGGLRSSYPHAKAGNELLRRERDKFVLIDSGAKFEGYCADLTRMVFWDKIPKVILGAYRVVEEAQELAISLIREGVRAKDIAVKVERLIARQGLAENIFHGLGHGVGLEVHERPILNRDSNEVLRAGMVVTLEPGLYFPGLGGVRKEDLVVVEKSKGKRI